MVEQIAIEKFRVLNKSFLTLKDISILLGCGESKAQTYRNRFIKENNYKNNYFKSEIPLNEFIKFYKIDIDIIRDNYILVKQGEKNARVN